MFVLMLHWNKKYEQIRRPTRCFLYRKQIVWVKVRCFLSMYWDFYINLTQTTLKFLFTFYRHFMLYNLIFFTLDFRKYVICKAKPNFFFLSLRMFHIYKRNKQTCIHNKNHNEMIFNGNLRTLQYHLMRFASF